MSSVNLVSAVEELYTLHANCITLFSLGLTLKIRSVHVGEGESLRTLLPQPCPPTQTNTPGPSSPGATTWQ